MTLRASPIRAIPITVAFLLNVVVGPLAPLTQLTSAPVLALSGSDFNVTDANLTDDSAKEIDWCTDGLSVITKDDLPTGQTDNSYKAAKENELDPEVEFGSIPNNKVDLQRLYISSETTGAGKLLIYVGWIRNDTTGTGTISFEMNQSDVVLSNGINHQRTVGDLLIEFNFQANPGSQGGYEVELTYRTWEGTEWSDSDDLGNLAEGSVNADPIEDCRNGDAELGTGQFGEFALNLTDLIGGQCRAFGSIFAKSRASEQLTSELKEVMAPVPVDFSTCGQITILKEDENGDPLGGATFSVTPNPFTGSGSLEVTDNQDPDDNDADGVIHLSAVEPDDYEVCETEAPAGYILDDTCQTLTVGQNGSAEFGPFVNGLGAIHWVKKDAQSDDKICCATFTLEGTAGAADGFGPLTVVDNGTNDEDADPGELSVSGLLLGTYLITETVPPNGYDLPADADQEVVLGDESTSAGDPFMDPPQADASITKDAVVDPIVAGADASFDIVVSAGGTGTSEDVMLTDLNETDHTWTITGADAANCGTLPLTVDPGETLSCDFGNVANGDSRSITITMASDADDCANGIENAAEVSSSNDHDESNNEDSASISVLCPNPGVTKDAEVSPITVGDDAVFTVNVTAGGSGPATNVVLTDVNDSGHDWDISGADKDACGADLTIEAGDTLTCSWAEIPSGESRSITITMASGEEDCELGIDNTASIEADADVDESNNEDSAHIAVLCPNPGVVKTADVSPINAGDDASFTIVVSASGTGNSQNVVLTDTNQTSHSWAVSGADAGDCNTPVAPGEDLVCDFGTIPNGQSRTVTITMESDADDCAIGIANTASMTAVADTDESDNESSASIDVDCPDVVVEKTGSGTVNATETVFFEITVSNDGDGDAYDFTFTDTLPDLAGGWTLVEPIEAGCQLNGLALSCAKDVFEADDSFTLRVEGVSAVEDCGALPNEASASASNEAEDDLGNNSDGHTIVVQCPGLNIMKTAGDSPIVAGDNADFTVTVWNTGPGTALDVTVHDELPDDVQWGKPSVVGGNDNECQLLSSVVLGGPEHWSYDCSLGDLAPVSGPEGGVEIVISGETDNGDCGTLTNVAFAQAANDDEVGPAEATVVVRCPALVIDKAADTEVVHFVFDADGDVKSVDPEQVTWTLTYTLTDGPVTDAVITDPLPDFLVLVSANDGGVYDEATRTITWELGDLTVDGSDSVSFVTTVDPDAPETDPLVNVATVDSQETAPDEGEDSIRVTSEAELGGNPTPTPEVPDTAIAIGPAGEPVSIPVELLIVLFFGSLGTLAVVNVRAVRRRR